MQSEMHINCIKSILYWSMIVGKIVKIAEKYRYLFHSKGCGKREWNLTKICIHDTGYIIYLK